VDIRRLPQIGDNAILKLGLSMNWEKTRPSRNKWHTLTSTSDVGVYGTLKKSGNGNRIQNLMLYIFEIKLHTYIW
jgi:hypothetical protein